MDEKRRNHRDRIEFPKGCEECDCNSDWQCLNGCLWRENYWKYDEIMSLYVVSKWAEAGVDLNRLDNLTPNDFLKIHIIRKIL